MNDVNQSEFWIVYKEYLKFCDLPITNNYFKVS